MSAEVVLCIVFRKIKTNYEFLLLKRSPEEGDFWQPIGGKVEKGDKGFLEAAYREVFEETGISQDKIINVIENFYQFTFDTHYLTGEPTDPVIQQVYAFEVKKDVKVILDANASNEHEKYDWFSYDKAIKNLKWQNNKDSFEKLKPLLIF
jgi:8-oxo-dGTP pyrophosphatase MutT (NUDIX family)